MKTKILLVDDHKIVREGFRILIEKESSSMEVVGEATDGKTSLELAQKLKPDVVIMDVAMPGLNGIEATRHMTLDLPGVKVIILSMHSEKRFVTSSLKAGAMGYLLKDCAFRELAEAIRCVLRGQVYLSPKITGIVIEDYIHRVTKTEPKDASVLSAREREVLQLLTEGQGTKDIADRLNISVKTVETHRMQIMTKLDIHTIAELTKYAIREGITSLGE
jgi:DNA-binding NarL/FixJ family response regulator